MEGLIILVLIASAVGSGFLALLVAESKGHGESWFLAGLFMGPIGVLAAAGLGDRTSQKYLRSLVPPVQEAPENRRDIEVGSDYQSLVSASISPYDVPQSIIRECIQEAVLEIFDAVSESFFQKSTDLQKLCERIASTKLKRRVIIDADQMISGIKEIADERILEITFGPFGGIDKIRVLNRST